MKTSKIGGVVPQKGAWRCAKAGEIAPLGMGRMAKMDKIATKKTRTSRVFFCEFDLAYATGFSQSASRIVSIKFTPLAFV